MRVLRLEVSVYNVYIIQPVSNNVQLLLGGAGEENLLVEVTVNSKEENS